MYIYDLKILFKSDLRGGKGKFYTEASLRLLGYLIVVKKTEVTFGLFNKLTFNAVP